jgi:Uma2 family endonuclease
VAGQDEDEDVLRNKAQWYLDHGVELVWLILPSTREVIVIERASELRCSAVDQLVEHPSLPGLTPKVSELFAQLERG